MGFVSKELTKIGIEEEVTEGTYVAPSAATSYVAPLSDGYSISGSKDLKERNILTSGFNSARSRVGQKSVEFQLNVEARGSGVEGGVTDYDPLLKNMVGTQRQLAARKTSSTGHTTTVINLADTSDIVVGDIVCVLEAGAHHISPVITVTTNTSIELLVAAGSAFSDAVEIAKFTTYTGSNDQADFKSLSLSYYHGDEVLEKGVGCRPTSMALSNFTTGEIASFDFSGDGLSFEKRVAANAPHTPTFDDEVPPLILGACVYVDGSQIDVNEFSFSIEHSNGFITSTCSEDGRIAGRKTGKRNVTGSFNPYLDDTDVSLHEKFFDNTAYSVFAFAANPSGVTGEYDLGSIFAVYMPNCVSNSDVVEDIESINITSIEFKSDGGEEGNENEIFLSFI
jgi:hypothetical protein